jgi:hypothetical protein
VKAGGTVLETDIGDVVRFRKAHPCGADEWRVVRLGADIGVRCLKCGRRIVMERAVFEKRVKVKVSRGG